ncbi:hypothetical protein [Pseudomonas poae]|uniref:hypothetical protein n=1 Tax=Pseudomonas poae TaxID=200451 RepID=UPI0012FCD233|nr:hypothetical protein [Pseudomonas poae]
MDDYPHKSVATCGSCCRLMPWWMAELEIIASGMRAFLEDLGFEWFGVRASSAHENPDDKDDRVRIKNTRTPSPLMLEFGS